MMNIKNISTIKYLNFINSLMVFGVLSFCISCLGVKPGAVKGAKKLYETFFVGEEGTQYFIKPLILNNNIVEEIKLDITFRYKNVIKDSAIINMSFLNKEIFRQADSLIITNDTAKIIIKEVKYMFSERSKDIYNSRFSSKTLLLNVEKLFKNSNWNLIIYKKGIATKYIAPQSTKKKIDMLRYEIFTLF